MAAETDQGSALNRLRDQAQHLRKIESQRDASDKMRALLGAVGVGGLAAGGAMLGGRVLKASPIATGAVSTLLGGGAGLLTYKKLRDRQHERFLEGGLRPADSSMIHAVGRRDGESYLRFNTGRVYRYPDVTDDEHMALLTADSLGKHFNATLRARAAEKVR